MLIPLTFFPSKCLVIHGYAMTLFLSEVLPTFPTLDFSLLWMTAAVSSPAFLYVHVHTCTHIHTHKIRQPNRNQFMPFLCLKLWNGFPKYSKQKKKIQSSYHGLQGPARPDPHLTHLLIMYLPDRFHFRSTYTQHPFHSSLQGLCTIFPHMKVLVAQLCLAL